MKKSVLAVLAMVLVGMLVVSGFRGSGASNDDWRVTIAWQDPALSKDDIVSSDKLVYVYFHTEWCSFCRKMESTTFSDLRVQEILNDKFTALEINPEMSGTTNILGERLTFAETATRLGVRGYPASFFFTSDGDLIGGQPGYIEAGMFADLAEYIGGGYRTKYSFDEYKPLPADRRE